MVRFPSSSWCTWRLGPWVVRVLRIHPPSLRGKESASSLLQSPWLSLSPPPPPPTLQDFLSRRAFLGSLNWPDLFLTFSRRNMVNPKLSVRPDLPSQKTLPWPYNQKHRSLSHDWATPGSCHIPEPNACLQIRASLLVLRLATLAELRDLLGFSFRSINEGDRLALSIKDNICKPLSVWHTGRPGWPPPCAALLPESITFLHWLVYLFPLACGVVERKALGCSCPLFYPWLPGTKSGVWCLTDSEYLWIEGLMSQRCFCEETAATQEAGRSQLSKEVSSWRTEDVI